MIRMQVAKSVAGAMGYFLDELSVDDITQELLTSCGQWFGKGAARLGLSGAVSREAFASLLGNVHPVTGENLSNRVTVNGRAGLHITVDAPKSVTAVAELFPESGVFQAFQAAASATMQEAEKRAQTRVRKDGADYDRVTGEVVAAAFVHRTTRPVDGKPDPQTHVHFFVFNRTYDEKESEWKALQGGGMWEDAHLLESVFRSELLPRLAELGFQVEVNGSSWEIAGVPQSVIEKFSNRSRVIESEAERLGVEDPRQLGGLGARTREPKSRGAAYSEMRAEWAARLSAEEHAALIKVNSQAESRRERGPQSADEAKRESLAAEPGKEHQQGKAEGFANPGRDRSLTAAEQKTLDEAIRMAVGKAFERSAVVPERELLKVGLDAVPGRARLSDVAESLKRHDVITREVEGKRLCTTAEVLTDERRLIELVVSGKGRYVDRSAESSGKRTGLTPEQQEAVRLVLSSPDLVTVLEGRAGVGKTRLTSTAVQEAWNRIGCPVVMLAPTTRAAHDVLRSEGHKSAETVARFLIDADLSARAKYGIVWVDEAGQLGIKDVTRVLERAAELGARVVFAGDSRQHRSVSRGGWLDALKEHAGVRVATVEGVMRQKGSYKSVVESINQGRMVEAVHKLDEMGALRVHPREQVVKEAGKDFVASKLAGQKALLVVQTHRQAAEATAEVRQQLRDAGKLGREDRQVWVLKSRNLTEFERNEGKSYNKGDIVEFHKQVKTLLGGTFERNSRWKVLGHDPFGNVLVSGNRQLLALPLGQGKAWQVYEPSSIWLTKGDVVRITKNTKVETLGDKLLAPFVASRREPSHPLRNGQFGEVKWISPRGKVVLTTGHVLTGDFGHLAYGYAATSQTAQGLTVERTIGLSTSDSGPASNSRHFNVAVTRGSKSVRLYTDSKESLIEAVGQSDHDLSGTSLVERGVDAPRSQLNERAKRKAEEAMRERARAAEEARAQAEQSRQFTLGRSR